MHPAPEQQSSQRRTQSWAEPILDQSAGDHEQGEREAADRIGPRGFGIREINPPLV